MSDALLGDQLDLLPAIVAASGGLSRSALAAGVVPDVLAVWDWEFDLGFVRRLGHACAARGLAFAAVREDAPAVVTRLAEHCSEVPAVVLDRLSDVLPELVIPLCTLHARGSRTLNHATRMAWCRDKATMHLELVAAGIQVPYGVIISTEHAARAGGFLADHAQALGAPFVIKPAEGGGGEGVVLDASTAADVARYLDERGYDKVILQRLVMPCSLGGHRGWFRVFYLAGEIVPCWWDDQTHVYRQVSAGEEEAQGLGRLRKLTAAIAAIAGIDFFTTEIALDQRGETVVVDFVNEMPDLRGQSEHADGVPEPIIASIVRMLVEMAVAARHPSGRPASVLSPG
jgi:glutathione synthase/RimK-type ligase-like ATP-grasp enzyme